MSRKREAQREDKKELARQMGVRGREVPQKLIEHERVTEPRVAITVVVEHWPTGLLHKLPGLKPKPRALHLDVGLWCVSRGEARLVRSVSGPVTAAGLGVVAVNAAVADQGHDVVRYKRPGSFVLLVSIGEGDGSLSLPSLSEVLVDGTQTPIVELAKSTALTPVTATPSSSTSSSSTSSSSPSASSRWGASVVARGAVDRIRETIRFPFMSPDGQVGVAVDVDLRL